MGVMKVEEKEDIIEKVTFEQMFRGRERDNHVSLEEGCSRQRGWLGQMPCGG
jgi:hypothetical protein